MSNESVAKDAAEAFRADHHLGTQPVSDIAQLIEHSTGAGVALIRVPSTARGHGMTMTLGDETYIAVGCTPHPMRLRSTLAHELGHFCLGTVNRELGTTGWGASSPQETQADAFARHLLVPVEAVHAAAKGRSASENLLSDIVQSHMASPHIVTIQLRDAGIIDFATSEQWKKLSTPQLATQYGWRPAYDALSTQSNTPKAPQRLLAKAIEGYRWGIVPPATIARLSGDADFSAAEDRMAANGIERGDVEALDVTAPRPSSTGDQLTAEELALLTSGDD